MEPAIWLMQRFDISNELIGDLVEQHADRSRMWFLLQAIVAVIDAVQRTVRRDTRLVLLTMFTSAIVLLLWAWATKTLYVWSSDNWVHTWLMPAATWIDGVRVGSWWLRVLFIWWEWYGGGLQAVWCIGSAYIGWFIARRQSAAFVMLSTIAQLPFALWWASSVWSRPAGYVALHPIHPLNFWVLALLVVIGMPLSMLAGGMTHNRRQERNARA